MTQLLIILTVLVSSSAFAEMSQFYNNHVEGTVYGRSPNTTQQYVESRGNTGAIFNNPESSISQSYFNEPNGVMQNRTIFDAPMGNTPMGMPQAAPDLQQMTPIHPFGPGLAPTPFGR